MTKSRLEAFSDGVIAIIITIMVLELKVPHGSELTDLRPLIPVFLSYVLSFLYVGIYWNNHHHMLQAVQRINGATLWANMHLLFWLSLFPFSTAWMGENHFAQMPVIVYGINLVMAATAYYILTRVLIKHHGHDSVFSRALGRDFKGRISVVIYLVGIALSAVSSWLSVAAFAGVAILWLVPDKRFERALERK